MKSDEGDEKAMKKENKLIQVGRKKGEMYQGKKVELTDPIEDRARLK